MGDLTKEQKAAIQAAIDKKKKDAEGAANKTEGKKKPITSSPKKGESYDVYDPETMKAAEDKGYHISKIDESVRYTGTKVGSQSIWDPESGFYYTQGAPKPNLDKYMQHHAEAIAEYKSPQGDSGPEAWKRDHLKAANTKDSKGRYGRNDPAIKHVITKTDDNYYNATGKRLLDRNKADWDVPGVQLYNLPGVSKAKPKEKKPEEKVEVQPGPGVINPARQPFTKRGYIPPKTAAYAPWWMQDIVKTTGAANDLMRVKQYMPWQAEPEVYLPDATFYDPTRELAANAEQANIQTQGLAAFTGPQALSARSSAIQGQGAKNAADIMARYNNLNVGIANQLSGQRSDIMNTAAQNQANMDTQLWDKYTVANQQFDNAKNQARQHLRQSYIDAITNRAKTQALNTMYPNYYTDPSRGGFVNFKGDPNKIRANRPDFTNEYRDAFELTGSHAGAMDYLRYKKGMPATKGAYDGYGEGYDESANYLKNQKYPGPGASYNTTTEAE